VAASRTAKARSQPRAGRSKDYPYGFASRFEGKPGTNPEELLGAAHAGCFTMALSLILGEAKLTATQMDTTAEVTLEQVADGYAITSVHLTLRAKIPGADQAKFAELAAKAKAGCPVSKLFKTEDHAGRGIGQLGVRQAPGRAQSSQTARLSSPCAPSPPERLRRS